MITIFLPSQAVLLLLVLNFCYLCQVVRVVILINATISAGYFRIYVIIINAFNSYYLLLLLVYLLLLLEVNI